MEGYIKLHRQILDSRVWANEGLFKVWVWCLLKANYKDAWVTVKTGRAETEVLVKPGQFIFGRKSAGKALKMPPSTVWKRILKLENMQNLNTKRNTHYTIISIVNWATYQDDILKGDTKGDRQVTGKEQASDTDKKYKKDKKPFLPDGEQEKLFPLPEPDKPKAGTHEFIKWWCAAYQFKMGKKYIITGYGKFGKLVKTLLSQMTLDDLKFMAMDFFLSEHDFHSENGYTFEVFRSVMQKLNLHTSPEWRQNSIEYLDIETFERVSHE